MVFAINANFTVFTVGEVTTDEDKSSLLLHTAPLLPPSCTTTPSCEHDSALPPLRNKTCSCSCASTSGLQGPGPLTHTPCIGEDRSACLKPRYVTVISEYRSDGFWVSSHVFVPGDRSAKPEIAPQSLFPAVGSCSSASSPTKRIEVFVRVWC